MSLTIDDIVDFKPGTVILYYSGNLGWCKAVIQQRGLNYVKMRGAEGHREGQVWVNDIHEMLQPNRYHLYIPPPVKKPARVWWYIRRILTYLIKRIPQ